MRRIPVLGLFQSTRPRGARQRITLRCPRNLVFQSTRPRGARPRGLQQLQAVTGFNPRAHAGRDSMIGNMKGKVKMFQSTRPRGARLQATASPFLVVNVSIHAPTRGATSIGRTGKRKLRGFNPRAHAGRDKAMPTIERTLDMFQSTRPRGARPQVDVNYRF